MSKFEKSIKRSHAEDFRKAKEFFSVFDYSKAEPLFLKSYHYYKDKNQLRKAYEALEKYIIILITNGRYQKAHPKVCELFEYSIRTKKKRIEAFAYGSKGFIHKSKGDFDKSLEFTKKAKKIFRELKNFEDLNKAYNNIGTTYYFQGNYKNSLKNYKKAEQICIENNILESLSGIYQVISFSYLALNNLEKFREYSEKIFDYLNHVKNPQRQAEIINNLCIPPFHTDEFSETLSKFLLELLEDLNEHNIHPQRVKTLRNLTGISIKQGKYAEAKDYLKQALDISEGLQFEIDKAYIYNNLGFLGCHNSSIWFE